MTAGVISVGPLNSLSMTYSGGSFVPMIPIEHIIEASKKIELKEVASDNEAQAINETLTPRGDCRPHPNDHPEK